MDVDTLTSSKTTASYFRRLVKLMDEFDGSEISCIDIDTRTGEIFNWDTDRCYDKNYATIQLVGIGKLTPKVEVLKNKLYKKALSGESFCLDYDDYFILTPYSSDVNNVIATAGYLLKRAKRICLEK